MTCYLCLQAPTLDFSREVLIREQDSVEAQLVESQDLLREREERLVTLRESLAAVERDLQSSRVELDFHTKAYVSARAGEIASVAARRSALKAREHQLEEYLVVLRRLDESQKRIAELTVERDQLIRELDLSFQERAGATKRIEKLEENFNGILERFQPPAFGEERSSSIDRRTYLPIYHGRRFDDLSSPGLATLVNLAHALAHHVTAIEEDLCIPNLLIVDGLSEHLGSEGLDPERLASVYDYLISLSRQRSDALQVIVVDNEVPRAAREFIRLELSETERLIPAEALESGE